MSKPLLVVLSLLLLVPFIVHRDIHPVPAYDGMERFDPSLHRLNSVSKLERYTDSLAREKGIQQGSFSYVELLEAVIENRFYHGFSHYTVSENWMAAIAGRLIKEDYACKVNPESILQHPNAACSQQALVMMAVLRNRGIDYRSLGFPHHYAMEVKIGGEWFYFDANMEPGITAADRKLSHWHHHNDSLKRYFNPDNHHQLDYQFGSGQTAIPGLINEIPARNASLFHAVTTRLSGLAWVLPILMLLFQYLCTLKIPALRLASPNTQPVVLSS